MSETSLVLFIDLKPEERIDLRVAAKAAIAWADLVEDVGGYFDPQTPPSIDLEAAAPGSQKLKAIISSLSEDPKATLRTAIVAAIVFIAKDTITWSWEQVLEYINGPDAPADAQMLSEDERAMIANDVVRALEARVAEEQAGRLYEELSAEPSVTGVGINNTIEGRPQTIIHRDAFPVRIHVLESEGFERRSRTEEVDLVLFRPILTPETNRRWGFTWPHGKIGAAIKDETFLERLASGDLGIPLTQGIVFSVQLEITEERRSLAWEVKEYNILRVMNVTAPGYQDALNLEPPQQE